jgi:UDP-N-acetylmuramate--alanine ligase
VLRIDGADELPLTVRSIASPGDIVVCLGAGTITQWAYALPGQLGELDRKRAHS